MARAVTPAKSRTESKIDLLNAAQAAVSEAEERSASRRGRRRNSRFGRIAFATIAGLVVGGSGYILSARPAWFFTPDPEPPPLEIQDASVRLMLVREAERIRQYQTANGQLPDSLAEAGSMVTGVRYTRVDDSTFRLSAAVGSTQIGFQSDDSPDGFLGNALKIINRRGE
jgi:hypothetical protein